MEYRFKSHPTEYCGVVFRSRLEARWAAFFEAVGFDWEYEPIDLDGWTPDFRISCYCGCGDGMANNGDNHVFLCEVKPYDSIEQFAGHKCFEYEFGRGPSNGVGILGNDPSVTQFGYVCGDGGGYYSIDSLVHSSRTLNEIWKDCGNSTQWIPDGRRMILPFSVRKPNDMSPPPGIEIPF